MPIPSPLRAMKGKIKNPNPIPIGDIYARRPVMNSRYSEPNHNALASDDIE